jgi:hypothetical protein
MMRLEEEDDSDRAPDPAPEPAYEEEQRRLGQEEWRRMAREADYEFEEWRHKPRRFPPRDREASPQLEG